MVLSGNGSNTLVVPPRCCPISYARLKAHRHHFPNREMVGAAIFDCIEDFCNR